MFIKAFLKNTHMLKDIFDYLNKNLQYAVLRNFENLPEGSGRDIDIIIEKRKFKEGLPKLINIISDNGFYITSLYRSEKMTAITCLNVTGNCVHFDFLFNTSLHGIIFIDAECMIKQRVFNGRIYHVSQEFEFLDKYLYLKALGHQYPEKYGNLKEKVLNGNYINIFINSLTRYKSFKQLNQASRKSFIISILIKQLRHNPRNQISFIISCIYYNIKNRIRNDQISIGFSGVDGVGKTTIANSICKIFSETTKVNIFKLRPALIKHISTLYHKTDLESNIDSKSSNKNMYSENSIPYSYLRLACYTLDFIFGYLLIVRNLLFERRIVIFDKYFNDIILNPSRYSIFLNHRILYNCYNLFIPKLKYSFLITANLDNISKREQVRSNDILEDPNSKKNYISLKKGHYIVSNNGTTKECINEILSIIITEQDKKIKNRLLQP